MKASESPAWAAATSDCSLSKWVGMLWRIERSQRWMLSDSVSPYYTDGPIRKKSHGSEEFLRSYDYQLEDLPKGAIWSKDPVTFHGTSHPINAPRFVGVNSNVNRRKVHEQDD